MRPIETVPQSHLAILCNFGVCVALKPVCVPLDSEIGPGEWYSPQSKGRSWRRRRSAKSISGDIESPSISLS